MPIERRTGERRANAEPRRVTVALADVVLMAIKLPGVSGIEVIQQLGLLAPASRVLILTRSEQNQVVEAIVAGASRSSHVVERLVERQSGTSATSERWS
jgi:DNA-binding NarL/FixJ family response regulator